MELKDLSDLIVNAEVTDAILVHGLLKKNNIEIPADVKQSFLELLCFSNADEPLDDELVEERWFRQTAKAKERFRKTWKDHDLADQIFSEIEPKDVRAFSCIIRGMCKFYQVERAWALFNDCLSRNIELDVESFNAILNVSNFIKESGELRWQLIQELLTNMKTMNVQPNLGTLNACLGTIATIGGRQPKDYALKILAEFKKINIEPSLGSWFSILQIFCRERGPVSHVLVDIMNQIEGKEHKIRDLRDTFFFMTAMDVCRNHLHDRNLAKRVNDLLHLGDNYNLIGDSLKESIYYRNYFSILIATEPLETFMETYHYLVPNVYIPEPFVMEEILKQVEVTGAIEHIPILWSHMVLFDHISRENLVNLISRLIIQNKPNTSLPNQENLAEQFTNIAWDIWTKIEEKNEIRTKPIVWTGKLLTDIIRMLGRGGEMEKASAVFDKLTTDQHKILGEPEFIGMDEFVDLCILKKQPSKAISCLQLCTDIGFPESRSLAKKICKNFTLDETHSKKIAYLVGAEVLQEAENELNQASSEQ